MKSVRTPLRLALTALILANGLPVQSAAPRAPAKKGEAQRAPVSGPDAAVITAFQERLDAYLALHRKLEATLPKLPKNASPAQRDANQRALSELIRGARSGAQQGDLFNHDMQAVVRRALARVFGGPDGKALKSSIMDENPGLPKLAVNGRYPDEVPLSTMPPEVLSALPKLEEDMEYRFVGESLVLYDAHAHLIVDLMDDVLPI